MPFLKTVLILSFLFGFIFHYYYEIKVQKEKDRAGAITRSFVVGLVSILTGLLFYYMIFGGIVLWDKEITEPTKYTGLGGFPGRILITLHNFVFYIFGSYANKVSSVILLSLPPIFLWDTYKRHYNFL